MTSLADTTPKDGPASETQGQGDGDDGTTSKRHNNLQQRCWPIIVSGSSTGSGLVAPNVDGWDFTLLSSSATNCYIGAETLTGQTILIDGATNDGTSLNSFDVKADNGTLFTLNSVGLAMSGPSVGSSGTIELIGYLNGVAVTGATISQTVTDANVGGQLVTFNTNQDFQGINEFRVVTNGSYQVTGAFGIDNINATNFTLPGPVVTVDSGNASFVAGNNTTSTPVAVDSGLTVTDTAASTLASASVQITGNYHAGEDVLAFTNTNNTTYGNITASYSGGALSLSSSGATATTAQWQAALEAVTYTDTAITPNNLTRTISFTVNDGSSTSTAATRGVTVTDTDQTPIVTSSSHTVAFTAGDNTISTPVAVDSGITVTDADNTTLASASAYMSSGLHSSEDVLAFTNTSSSLYGNISASYNSGTGVLSLSSASAAATLAQWQAALRAVTYTDTAVTPNTAVRIIRFNVNDGASTSANTSNDIISVADTDQSPIVTTDGGSTAFIAGNNTISTPVAVDGGLTVTDLDNTTESSATVAILGNAQTAEDLLAFTNTSSSAYGNITASYDSGNAILTLTSASASATLAQWRAALRAVTYTDTAVIPNTATRTIGFTLNDGANDGGLAVRDVTVTASDQTPIVTASAGHATFIEADDVASTPVPVDPSITVVKNDNVPLTAAAAGITGNFQSGQDALGFVNNGASEGNIAGSYNSSTGLLTLVSAGATATLAQWQAALQAITYTDTAPVPNTSPRTVSFAVTDGTVTSSAVTRGVAVTATHQSPIVTASSGSTPASPTQSAPVTIDPGITVHNPASPLLVSATVSITGNFQPGEDVLAVNPITIHPLVGDVQTTTAGAPFGSIITASITGSYNAATGVLTLTSSTGLATDAQMQLALQAVTYADTSATPNTATRTIAYAVNDGTVTSQVATDNITFAASITPTTVSVYRFFDTANGTQFLTANASEASAMTDPNSPDYQPALVAETNGFRAVNPAVSDPNQVAVYRFFDVATGAHFFSASASERDAIMNPASSDYRASYVDEPDATFYEHGARQSGDVAVYRLFNTANGTHFFTSDPTELAGITTPGSASYQPNLISEGIAFYAPTGAAPT